MGDDYQKNWVDKAADGTAGAAAAYTGGAGVDGMFNTLTHTGVMGLADKSFGVNDLLRPMGLNYDEFHGSAAADAGTPEAAAESIYNAPPEVGESALPELDTAGFQAAEDAGSMGSKMLGGAGGALGLVAGGMQFASGAQRAFGANATEQDEFHGGLDMVGGGAGAVAGGLGLATALGAGEVGLGAAGAALGVGTIGAASAVAAPVAAAIGLGVAGDHHAEEMDLWGTGKDGKAMGTFEALDNLGQNAGNSVDSALGIDQNSLGGEVLGGGVRALTDIEGAGAAAAVDVGLGIDAMGASSGLFGTATNDLGKTYNMGAFQALDHAGQAAGAGVDDALGLDQNSLGGEVVGGLARGAVDVAGSGLALAADVGGAVVGGVEAAAGWIGDFF